MMPLMMGGPRAEGSTAVVEAVWSKRRFAFDRELSSQQRQRRVAELGRRQLEQFPAMISLLSPAEAAKVCDIFGTAIMRKREADRRVDRNGPK